MSNYIVINKRHIFRTLYNNQYEIDINKKIELKINLSYRSWLIRL